MYSCWTPFNAFALNSHSASTCPPATGVNHWSNVCTLFQPGHEKGLWSLREEQSFLSKAVSRESIGHIISKAPSVMPLLGCGGWTWSVCANDRLLHSVFWGDFLWFHCVNRFISPGSFKKTYIFFPPTNYSFQFVAHFMSDYYTGKLNFTLLALWMNSHDFDFAGSV